MSDAPAATHTFKFPSPVGGVPFDLDFGPCIFFTVAYALVSILALYRLVVDQAADLESKQQTADEARAEVEKRDVELDQALQDKETLSNDMDGQIQSLQDELKELKQERDKLSLWR